MSATAEVDSLLGLLEGFAGQHVWVVGDLMLDEYVMGAVNRISPEAPVAVVRVADTEHRLGGAANVARQVAVLGATVCLAGVIGEDAKSRWDRHWTRTILRESQRPRAHWYRRPISRRSS